MTSQIRCLLWDFGDTLCDERFIWSSGPRWMELYRTFDDGIGHNWSLGEITTLEFASEVAARLCMSAEAVVAHMHERCNHIAFFEHTYTFFRAHHLPQAIVTINPDFFSEVIVPLHRLDEPADAIVTSWEEGTSDKARLAEIAIERLGIDCEPHESLLIDNRQDCVDAWQARGGLAYLFTSDEAFRVGVGGGLKNLISPSQ